jgi:hypothetical protein
MSAIFSKRCIQCIIVTQVYQYHSGNNITQVIAERHIGQGSWVDTNTQSLGLGRSSAGISYSSLRNQKHTRQTELVFIHCTSTQSLVCWHLVQQPAQPATDHRTSAIFF